MPTEAQLEALRALARRHGWRLVVLFGSSAAGEGRDVDLAILPGRMPDGLEIGGWQGELEEIFAPGGVDMVLLHPDLSPTLAYRIFWHGRPLHEVEPGLFDRQRDLAFFRFADAEWLRREAWEDLQRHVP